MAIQLKNIPWLFPRLVQDLALKHDLHVDSELVTCQGMVPVIESAQWTNKIWQKNKNHELYWTPYLVNRDNTLITFWGPQLKIICSWHSIISCLFVTTELPSPSLPKTSSFFTITLFMQILSRSSVSIGRYKIVPCHNAAEMCSTLSRFE